MNLDKSLVITAITIVLSLSGYLFTYLNNLRLAQRQERLKLVDKRINEFYGPLYVTALAGHTAYAALLKKLRINERQLLEILKNSELKIGKQVPTNESLGFPYNYILREWRLWSYNFFIPLNEFQKDLIFNNAHLLLEEEVPHCLIDFLTHMSAYKIIIKKWDSGDFSENKAFLDYPAGLLNYASKSYLYLKHEQLQLIGHNRLCRNTKL